uniref:Uncharacterized protein n=1 Tax=Anopheles minimus TaxID=112268 RepID=A0A182WL65_9DIPT
MQSNATGSPPPIGARRVKTDLHTSEKLYIHSVGRSRSNSPMHAGLVGRHTSVTHRKAGSEPKGLVSSTHPPHATTNNTTTYLTVPHSVTTTVLHSPNRQRSSSTGTPSTRVSCGGGTAAAHHQRLLPPPPSSSSATIERSASVRLSTSPSRTGDHHQHHHPPNGAAGIANRSQLPARARLLTRRLQNNATPTNGSESPRSIDSLPRRTFSGSYKTATLSQFHNLANNNCMTDSASTATNSAEDLTLLDKSLRNSMLQDVVHFKKQLVRLRRILQETDTLNPFENNNGQFFTTAAAAIATANGSIGSAATTTTATTVGGPGQQEQLQQQQQQENVLIRESSVAALALLEDQRQELADLRRQVVYLQGELTAKDRTIRQQQNLIEKYEAEREKHLHSLSQNGGPAVDGGDLPGTVPAGDNTSASDRNQSADTISTATQTERLRPVSFGGQEGLGSRSEKHKNGLRTPTAVGLSSNATSSTTPSHHSTISNGSTTPKSKTQISSVYTQLSSVRHSIAGTSAPTTPTTATTTQNGPVALRRTSLGSSHNLSSFGLHPASDRSPGGVGSPNSNKPVRTTHIGTLPSPTTARPLSNGDRTVPPNGTKPTKTIPNRTATNGVTKLNGLNGTTKRTGIIRPPSSFGSSNSLVTVEQQLKSKSAPATPLVVASGKLLTPAATGGTDSGTNGHREVESCVTSESEKDTTPVVNGGSLVGNLKLPGGCADGSNLGSATPANGIVGH